jgi:hypothetical protein
VLATLSLVALYPSPLLKSEKDRCGPYGSHYPSRPQLFLVQDLNGRWQYKKLSVYNLMLHFYNVFSYLFKHSIFRQILASLGNFYSEFVYQAKKGGFLTGT